MRRLWRDQLIRISRSGHFAKRIRYDDRIQGEVVGLQFFISAHAFPNFLLQQMIWDGSQVSNARIVGVAVISGGICPAETLFLVAEDNYQITDVSVYCIL